MGVTEDRRRMANWELGEMILLSGRRSQLTPDGEPVCGLCGGVPESTSSIDQSRLSSMS